MTFSAIGADVLQTLDVPKHFTHKLTFHALLFNERTNGVPPDRPLNLLRVPTRLLVPAFKIRTDVVLPIPRIYMSPITMRFSFGIVTPAIRAIGLALSLLMF